MSLHIDYRPESLSGFYGSSSTIKSLRSKVEAKDHPHCYLFTGPSGCGKTTLGRIVARHFGALMDTEDPAKSRNYKEFDSADFRGIDTIRDIKKTLPYAVQGRGKARAFLLDECHKLTNDAQEALLKTLEETPDHIYFILATTNPDKLEDTLRRRCFHYEVSPLEDEEMDGFLKEIVDAEGKEVPDDVIDSIVEVSMGSPGKALVALDKIIDIKPKDMIEQIELEEKVINKSIDLCMALIKKESWKKVSRILAGLKKQNPESIRIHVINFACGSLLKKKGDIAYTIMDSFRDPFYGPDGFAQLVLSSYETFYAEN